MNSTNCRHALARSSSGPLTELTTLSPELSRRTKTAFGSQIIRQRAMSPDLSLSRYRPMSPDFPRRARSPGRPRTLMESLLLAKMEALSTGNLVRTDSLDSCSSFGSMSSLPSDVCRCDDCLLGIVDFYLPSPAEQAQSLKKKGTWGGGNKVAYTHKKYKSTIDRQTDRTGRTADSEVFLHRNKLYEVSGRDTPMITLRDVMTIYVIFQPLNDRCIGQARTPATPR
ncbi:hypothetical protein EVAR_64246_1 [Eumeta japonica]|uniref:Uncharacterized protein n=1 Tax=Eumeta variegata TaxID=151549 RepID=A0A4C1Z7G2_EUMVA|nr:hypothetical protein EVAR_64246_1 [Eumeta japonica]